MRCFSVVQHCARPFKGPSKGTAVASFIWTWNLWRSFHRFSLVESACLRLDECTSFQRTAVCTGLVCLLWFCHLPISLFPSRHVPDRITDAICLVFIVK